MIVHGSGKRILHIVPFLWSGAGDVITRLAVSQSVSRTVAVVTSEESLGQSDWPAYRQRLLSGGIEHFGIDTFDRSSEVFWESAGLLEALVERWRPDVIHCHAGVPAAMASIVRERGARFRLVGQLHSWGANRPGWMDRMDLWAFGRCDVVVSNSNDYRRLLADSGIPEARIVSVPWGLDLEKIDRAIQAVPRRAPGEGLYSGLRIGYVGRIERRKGQADLVRMISELRKGGIDADLELIGPVADEAFAREVRSVVDEAGLGGRVTIRGYVGDVYPAVRRWDLFVSMSSDEGQGMAVLEAMALGVPVIACDAPGVRDFIVEWMNALLVRFPSPVRAAAAVRWLVENPHLAARMAGEARRRVVKDYSWGTTVSRTEQLYRRLSPVA